MPSGGSIGRNDPDDQEKCVKFNDLHAHCVIYQNGCDITAAAGGCAQKRSRLYRLGEVSDRACRRSAVGAGQKNGRQRLAAPQPVEPRVRGGREQESRRAVFILGRCRRGQIVRSRRSRRGVPRCVRRLPIVGRRFVPTPAARPSASARHVDGRSPPPFEYLSRTDDSNGGSEA